MDNGGCPGNGWSVITSASTNSQLAGVLAGFVFTGVIILIGRPGNKNTHTLGLFSATFVILAFDSYMFSLIAGGDTDPLCVRVWSEAMPASGMLAIGGVALLGGIAWLLDDSQIDTNTGDGAFDQQLREVNLSRLSRAMFYGVMFAVTLLLTATTVSYLDVALGRRIPDWLAWGAALLFTLSVGYTSLTLTRRRRHYEHKEAEQLATSALSYAANGILLYAIIGPVFAGILLNIPQTWWSPQPISIFVIALIVGLAIPYFLLILLSLAIPPHNKFQEEGGFSRKQRRPTSAKPTS